jgi:hypothetical protein
MRSRATDGMSASKCQGKWPDQAVKHRSDGRQCREPSTLSQWASSHSENAYHPRQFKVHLGNPGLRREDFDMASTNWTVGSEGELMLNGKKAPLIQGVVYSPTPIGCNYDFPPHGDFYLGGGGQPSYFQWKPWWQPDIDAMAAVGVNSIRTYSWFMWMPTDENMRLAKKPENMALAKEGKFPERSRDHTHFLDYCHAKGISVLMGVGWRPEDYPRDKKNWDNGFLEFYVINCLSLAKAYGRHPAVLGVVLGNEVDNAATFEDDYYRPQPQRRPDGSYLGIMNSCADALPKNFRDTKLILPAFHDNPFAYGNEDNDRTRALQKHVQTDLSKSFTATGINTYRGPEGTLPQDYKKYLIEGKNIKRPLLITEWGAPYSMRVDGKGAEISGDTVQSHAKWVRGCWKQFSDRSSFPFLAGGYYFEWTDEWWKAGERGQHNFNPDSSNNDAFPGKYGDEAWFGVMGTAVSNNRDPMVYWDDKKNCPVAPDKRIPRNTYNVLKQLYDKSLYIVNLSPNATMTAEVVTQDGDRVRVPVGPKSFARVITQAGVTGGTLITTLPTVTRPWKVITHDNGTWRSTVTGLPAIAEFPLTDVAYPAVRK